MNKTILTGRIANDLELRATPNGDFVCEFNLATNRPVVRDGERKADFISCVVWGKKAETLCNYQTKGNLIAVFGSIRTRDYEGADGKKVYKTFVLVDEIEFLEKKKVTNEKTTAEPPVEESEQFTDFGEQITLNTEITDDDLPF